MKASNRCNQMHSHLKPLAACVAALFGLAAHPAQAVNVIVSNCNDSGAGSLREIVSFVAESGDTADMTGLTCGTISLHTGAITIAQNELSLVGPGQHLLTISGKYNGKQENDRVLNHTGTGELNVTGLTIAQGDYYSSAVSEQIRGGCIQSAGNVFIANSTVALCSLRVAGNGSSAVGGAIYAANGVELRYSAVLDNSATAGATEFALGGGVVSRGTFNLFNSTIAGNTAITDGGVLAFPSTSGTGSVSIFNSTISGNHATGNVGGLAITGFPAATINTITNSTIAGNSAADNFGGMVVNFASVTIQNSTIGFNTTATTGDSAGLQMQANSGSYAATIESSIFSNNTAGGIADDLETQGTATIAAGANNLVYATHASLPTSFGLPQGTCPLLGPLANNGGLTQTLALLSGSPALAQGNNNANLTFDQRGTGYSRTSSGAFGFKFTDIGAYEMQRADIIFNAGFDGCS